MEEIDWHSWNQRELLLRLPDEDVTEHVTWVFNMLWNTNFSILTSINPEDLGLLFSSLFSYYVNAINWRTLRFWSIIIDFYNHINWKRVIFDNEWDYVLKFFSLSRDLEDTFQRMEWNTGFILSFLSVVSTKFNLWWFRVWTETHWENRWNTLKKPWAKNLSWKQRIMNSSFIFPPVISPNWINYIEELIWNRLQWNLLKSNNPLHKAALINAYIFLSHPFDDWNSRTSSLISMSYLESLWYRRFRFFTFLTETQPEFQGYVKFLEANLYKKVALIRKRIYEKNWVTEDWTIIDYMDIDEYEREIILPFSNDLLELYEKFYDYVEKNMREIFNFYRILEFLLYYNNESVDWNVQNTIKSFMLAWLFEKFSQKEIDMSKMDENYLSENLRLSKLSLKKVSKQIFSKFNIYITEEDILLYQDWLLASLKASE